VDNDGTPDYTVQICTSNSTQKHTYKNAGTYTAKLIVEDGRGGKVEKTVQITVKAVSSGGSQPSKKKGDCSTVTPQITFSWLLIAFVPLLRRILRK